MCSSNKSEQAINVPKMLKKIDSVVRAEFKLVETNPIGTKLTIVSCIVACPNICKDRQKTAGTKNGVAEEIDRWKRPVNIKITALEVS